MNSTIITQSTALVSALVGLLILHGSGLPVAHSSSWELVASPLDILFLITGILCT